VGTKISNEDRLATVRDFYILLHQANELWTCIHGSALIDGKQCKNISQSLELKNALTMPTTSMASLTETECYNREKAKTLVKLEKDPIESLKEVALQYPQRKGLHLSSAKITDRHGSCPLPNEDLRF